ncbi:MAG: hypothetical protein MK078_11860 [Crocinitomicaceae bacterium]|nr:hypothetical protein [Crocinitomicaceae bacterium]
MKKLAIYLFGIFLFSCQEEADFNPNKFEDEVLVINGILSENIEYQQIELSYATTINSDESKSCTTGTINLMGPSEIYTFTHIENGLYQSTVPFGLIPGDDYSLNVENNATLSSGNIKMASPILIDSGYSTGFSNASLALNSSVTQYLIYECYYADTSEIDTDTVWTKINVTSNNLEKTTIGPQNIFLRTLTDEYSIMVSNPLIKVITYTLSNEVGSYMRELEQFSLLNSTNNAYSNPPTYFTNEAYGLVYGTVKDSTIFQVSY